MITLKNKGGWSLIECMISILIISMIVLMCTMLIKSTTQYQLDIQAEVTAHSTLTQTQEMLRHILHRAGYMGCRSLPLPIRNATLLGTVPFSPITGTPTAEYYLSTRTSLKSIHGDVLIAQSLEEPTLDVRSNSGRDIRMISTHVLPLNTTYVITDCTGAEATSLHTQFGNNLVMDAPLSRHYGPNAHIGKLKTEAFYVADTQRKDTRGKTLSALFKVSLDTPALPQEWASDIKQMTVQYAIRDSVHFISGDQVNNWNAVQSVRINLCASVKTNKLICNSFITRARYDVGS